MRNNKEYKVKVIVNSVMYGHKVKNKLLDLYYQVSWKDYLEEEST